MGIFTKLLGSKNERTLAKFRPLVSRINEFEPGLQALSDEGLVAKTAEFKQKLEKGAGLDDILPEAFAVVREAAWRTIRMRHYDVQLVGGMVLHSGRIAEMRTGEGKTLVATLPAYLNALEGKGVHIVTVNDYLANRDAEWMGKVFRFLGLTVGTITHGYDEAHKQSQYGCDITYGTNSEFGFDYLRDNMKYRLDQYVQTRGLNYAIIDEVDSILIDEARTPLIISGPADEAQDKYQVVNDAVAKLVPERHFTIDEKSKSASLTDEGVDRIEALLKVGNLFSPENIQWSHHVSKALAAHACYKRDVDYLVHEGEVMIIDENTGRTMEGRRWSDGLHQAVEAKEGVRIQQESVTLATITYQNFYRMYDKLSGMTGTADTEAEEFEKIYKLDVVVVPTNKPIVRDDKQDMVFKTEAEKFRAVVDDIKERHGRGQPILVGTRNVDKSEVVSRLLKKSGIPHITLNAKFHRAEGEIIAQAGQPGAVTISTNMAGRGTDILLGGNPEYMARADVAKDELGDSEDPEREQEILAQFRWLSGSPESVPVETVSKERAEAIFQQRAASASGDTVGDVRARCEKEARDWVDEIVERYAKYLQKHELECKTDRQKVLDAGGLHVLGTERHESRRVDNQLRGRSGRQGDPGASIFYLSLEDDLMRIFAGDRLKVMMERLGMQDDEPIEAKMVTRSIANAQKRVEGHNFDIRKNLIEYDDVMNMQRKSVYALRAKVLSDDPMQEDMLDMIDRVVVALANENASPRTPPDEWNKTELVRRFQSVFGFEPNLDEVTRHSELEDALFEQAEKKLLEKQKTFGENYIVTDRGLVPKDAIEATDRELEPVWRFLLRQRYLSQIDANWRDHLTQMDHLREGIGLRGYGSRDPKIEYKREGHQLFLSMSRDIDFNVCAEMFNLKLLTPDEVRAEQERRRQRAEEMQRLARMQGAKSQESADAVGPGATAKKGNADRLLKQGARYKKQGKKGKGSKGKPSKSSGARPSGPRQ